MYFKVIPKFSLQRTYSTIKEYLISMHQQGINFRYLGYLRRSTSSNSKLSTDILIECLARLFKCHLRR